MLIGSVGELRTKPKSSPSGNSGGGGGGAAKINRVALYDTGGYTGSWGGSYGKLAMLHEKELVLNKGDTENFLTGMHVLDKIVSTIDLYSMNA
jgi:hypothetical protein